MEFNSVHSFFSLIFSAAYLYCCLAAFCAFLFGLLLTGVLAGFVF
jgi:hypothetical protein